MKRQEVKIDGSKILLSLFKKYKDEPWVLSSREVYDKINSLFSGKWGQLKEENLYKYTYGLKSGIILRCFENVQGPDNYDILFLNEKKYNVGIPSPDDDLNSITVKELKKYLSITNTNSIDIYNWYYSRYDGNGMKLTIPETKFLQEFLDKCSIEVVKKNKLKKLDKEEKKRKEIERVKSLKKSQTNLLEEFDKDGNGIIDVIEGSDDFMNLFKKHQKKIIELDKQYIQKFVKISNYLKTKRQNIQDVFSSIKNTKNKLQLKNNVGILKNQIHTYELLLFHSLNMITSLVEGDLIVFYEIYESFDKLNMFNSNWENEVSQKLSNIGDGLSNLMNSINSMERNIVSGLNTLSYVTLDGFSDLNNSLTQELQSINSSIDTNNLLTGIQTYQLYKINKQTKGLIG